MGQKSTKPIEDTEDETKFSVMNHRFTIHAEGDGQFRFVSISFQNTSFPYTGGDVSISEEYLERLYNVIGNFSKRLYESGEIPSKTKINFQQKMGGLQMKIRLDKYTKTCTKVPCADGIKKWKTTFTYEEIKEIFKELQKRGILTNVGNKRE